MDPIFSQPFSFAPPKPKGGMFGGGKFDMGQAIVAALNGYLAGTGNPVGIQNMQMMREMALRGQDHQQSIDDYNRQRADQNADWMTQYNYKLAHPEPTQGSEYERSLEAQGILPGSPEYVQHMATMTKLKENPMVMTPYGPMPYSAVMGGSQPEILQSLPPGAKPIGGAGPQAPRPFP